jgi:hypothetical protein
VTGTVSSVMGPLPVTQVAYLRGMTTKEANRSDGGPRGKKNIVYRQREVLATNVLLSPPWAVERPRREIMGL